MNFVDMRDFVRLYGMLNGCTVVKDDIVNAAYQMFTRFGGDHQRWN